MDYRPPSVQITQVQETTNVTAVVADLMAGIVGPAYNIVELDTYTYPFATIASGLSFNVAASGIDTNQEIDKNSIYAEFISEVGETVLYTGSVTLTGTNFVFSVSTGNIQDIFPRAKATTNNKYKPRIFYRALYKNRNKEVSISSYEDILYSAGKISSLNPLGFAAGIVAQNTRASFNVFPIPGSGLTLADWQGALDSMDTSDVYAVAPLTNDKDSFFTTFNTWATNRSLPKNSRPTKLYFSPYIKWNDGTNAIAEKQLSAIPKDSDGSSLNDTMFDLALYRLPKTGKKATAEGMAAEATSIGIPRVTLVRPDMAWINEMRHVLQCNPTYVGNTSGVSGGKAVLAERLVLTDGTVYQAGTIIGTAVYAKLTGTNVQNGTTYQNLSNFSINVYIPAPGYYLAVQQAALVSAVAPSDPKTQRGVGGIAKVDLSENFFGTEYTNIIAGGGNNVIIQPTLNVLPCSRHHLTTDMSTIESREDNIIHQLDVVTINFRRVLSKLVGKDKQDAKHYKLLRATLMAYAEAFKGKEWIKDVLVLGVTQSSTQPDKVDVTVKALPYYADNYIDLTIYY